MFHGTGPLRVSCFISPVELRRFHTDFIVISRKAREPFIVSLEDRAHESRRCQPHSIRARSHHRFLSRRLDRRAASAWDDPGAALERTVDAHIKSLRAKLKDVRQDADPIETHRGFGYSLRETL